jgi:hypothetical protein
MNKKPVYVAFANKKIEQDVKRYQKIEQEMKARKKVKKFNQKDAVKYLKSL